MGTTRSSLRLALWFWLRLQLDHPQIFCPQLTVLSMQSDPSWLEHWRHALFFHGAFLITAYQRII